MAALSRLPPVGLTMGLSPDTAHATDDIKKQLDYVDQDRGAQEAAAVRGKWHSTLPGAIDWCHVWPVRDARMAESHGDRPPIWEGGKRQRRP